MRQVAAVELAGAVAVLQAVQGISVDASVLLLSPSCAGCVLQPLGQLQGACFAAKPSVSGCLSCGGPGCCADSAGA